MIPNRALDSSLLGELFLSSHHFIFLLWILHVTMSLPKTSPPSMDHSLLRSYLQSPPSFQSRWKAGPNSSKYEIRGQGTLSFLQCSVSDPSVGL